MNEKEKKEKKKKTNEKEKGMNKSKITNEGIFVMKEFFFGYKKFRKNMNTVIFVLT